MIDKATVIADVCAAVSNGALPEASSILRSSYPFEPLQNAGRNFGKLESMRTFVRDGFIDRYSGQRLVFPGVLRLLSFHLPTDFPFHRNWKTDECHIAYYELSPTIDHEVPVSRGGADNPGNWVTTSMIRNMAKSNFLLRESGWTKHAAGDYRDWDGLTGWFLSQMQMHTEYGKAPFLKQWTVAATAVLAEVGA